MELDAHRILRHDALRWLAAVLVITLPAYGFLLLYRWATGDWSQPDAVVLDGIMRSWQTLAANFIIPLVLGVWILGFTGWRLVTVATGAAVLASYVLPRDSLAVQLLPGSFVRLALVTVALTILLNLATVWHLRKQQLMDVAYTTPALIIMVSVLLACALLLLPLTGTRMV